MNLEASHQHQNVENVNVSASGNAYWQPAEPTVTVTERAAQATVVAQNVVTHKIVIATVALAVAVTISAVVVAHVGNLRERAHQAEIQRTSRVVVL